MYMKRTTTILFLLLLLTPFTMLVASSSGSNSGIEVTGRINISVYPNPAHNNLFVSWYGSEVKAEVTVFDALGAPVTGYTIEEVESNTYKIQMSSVKSGVYFVKVTVGSYVKTERVIIN